MRTKAVLIAVVMGGVTTPCHAEWKINPFNDRMTDSRAGPGNLHRTLSGVSA
jgi:hypothetical protein